jgi:hypothetical protein
LPLRSSCDTRQASTEAMRCTRRVVSDGGGPPSETKVSSASAAFGERESSAAVELQLLQERTAKLREQNRALVEARERTEEERDELEAQVFPPVPNRARSAHN